MDLANGGINPAAVDHMTEMHGGLGRIVWMPTYDAEAAVSAAGAGDRPFAPVSRQGELLPETQAVLALIAEHDLVLATGHVSPEEGLLLVQEARRLGVRHIVVTHAMDTGWTVPQMQEAAGAGAFIEFAKPLGRLTIAQYVDAIRRVGPHFCIVSQAGVSHLPPELVGAFVVALVEHGFSAPELDLMMKHNPVRLLGLKTANVEKCNCAGAGLFPCPSKEIKCGRVAIPWELAPPGALINAVLPPDPARMLEPGV